MKYINERTSIITVVPVITLIKLVNIYSKIRNKFNRDRDKINNNNKYKNQNHHRNL